MQQQQERVPIFNLHRDVRHFTEHLNGYIRLGDPNKLAVKFRSSDRIIFHEVPHGISAAEMQQLGSSLKQQISLLHDLEAENIDQLRHIEVDSQQHQQLLPWERNIELVRVGDCPDHWLAASVDADMNSVRAKVGFKKYNFIGWYKPVIIANDQHRVVKETAAAPYDYFRYSAAIEVKVPPGSERVKSQQSASQQSAGSNQQATSFHLDARFCLAGNPMAHILDYRSYSPQWDEVDPEGSRARMNAALIPISDNETGRVYLAVVAARDIQPGEYLALDYGQVYWEQAVAIECSKAEGYRTAVADIKSHLRKTLPLHTDLLDDMFEHPVFTRGQGGSMGVYHPGALEAKSPSINDDAVAAAWAEAGNLGDQLAAQSISNSSAAAAGGRLQTSQTVSQPFLGVPVEQQQQQQQKEQVYQPDPALQLRQLVVDTALARRSADMGREFHAVGSDEAHSHQHGQQQEHIEDSMDWQPLSVDVGPAPQHQPSQSIADAGGSPNAQQLPSQKQQLPQSIPSLVKLLRNSSQGVQEQAARTLADIDLDTPANEKQIEECQGAIPDLVQLLRNSSQEMQAYAALALAKFAHNTPANKKLIGEFPSAIPSLVKLLRSSSWPVQKYAASALAFTAYDMPANQKRIGECQDAILSLVKLLGSSSQWVQHKATSALAIIAMDTATSRQIGRCQGAIPSLVRLLGSSSQPLQEIAARALADIAVETPTNRKLIGECQGAIFSLVQLLGSSSQRVQEQASRALANAVANTRASKKLVRECQDAIFSLVQLLGSSNQEMQANASLALANIADGTPAGQKLVGECQGAIPSLVKLLGSSSQEVQEFAAAALGNVVWNNPANKELVGECQGTIPSLVKLLGSSSQSVQGSAARALRSIVRNNPANKKLLRQCQGAVASLKQLQSSRHQWVQKQAGSALKKLGL